MVVRAEIAIAADSGTTRRDSQLPARGLQEGQSKLGLVIEERFSRNSVSEEGGSIRSGKTRMGSRVKNLNRNRTGRRTSQIRMQSVAELESSLGKSR